MRQTIFVVLALIVGAAVGSAFTLHASPQSVPQEDYRMGPTVEFKWPDENGQPRGVRNEDWISVTPVLGAIFQERVGPDKLTWVVLRDGWWYASESATFDNLYRYRQG